MTLVVVLACILFAFILSFNPNAYKSDLQLFVQQHTNRELTIDGDLKVILFPDLAIQVRQVTLSEQGRPDRFASIDDLRASMAILPLFKHKIVIDELEASGIRASFARSHDGRLNTSDLVNWLNGSDGPANSPDLILATDGMTVDIAGITLTDADITLRDDVDQTAWEVKGLSLTTGRIVRDTPVDVAVEGTIKGSGIEAGAKVTAKALVTLNLESHQINARDVAVGAKGSWPGSAWMPEPVTQLDAVMRIASLGFDLDSATLRGDRLALRAKGQGGAGPLEFAFDAPRFVLTPDSVAASALTSRLRVEGPLNMDLSLVGTGLKGSPGVVSFERLDAEMTSKRDARSMRSFISSPVQVQLHPLVASLPALKGDVKITPTDSTIAPRLIAVKGSATVALIDRPKDPKPLSLVGQFQSIPSTSLWTDTGIQSPLDGLVNLDLNLRAAQGPWETIEKSVAGTVNLHIDQAAIRGIDFSEGLGALRAIAKPSAEGMQFKGDPAKRTLFEKVEIGMRVDGEMGTLTKLDMTGPNWHVGLGKPADINLHDGTANLGIILNLLGPQRVTAGRVTVEVRSLVVPLRLTGVLSNPYVNIDWKDLERDRLGRALRQKLLEDGHSPPSASGAKAAPQ